MKRREKLLIKNVSEATVACLLTMVQGNVFLVSLSHFAYASQTGIVAGAIATIVLVTSHRLNRWAIAGVLAVFTAIVDYFSHPAQFGPVAVEAVITGLAAGILSLLIGWVIERYRNRTDQRSPAGSREDAS